MASPSMPRSSSTVTLAPLPCRNTEFTKKTHLFTRLFEPLDFFSPRIFLLQWVSHSLDGFYTGPSPDVLWRTVFILASLQICKIQKRWLRQAAGGWRWVRGFRQKLAHGGGVAVNVGVCRQVQIQQGSREGLHGRLAEHRAPARNQSIGHGTLENGRSLSGFGLCQKSNEGGCFLAPPAADFNAQDDQFAAP